MLSCIPPGNNLKGNQEAMRFMVLVYEEHAIAGSEWANRMSQANRAQEKACTNTMVIVCVQAHHKRLEHALLQMALLKNRCCLA